MPATTRQNNIQLKKGAAIQKRVEADHIHARYSAQKKASAVDITLPGRNSQEEIY